MFAAARNALGTIAAHIDDACKQSHELLPLPVWPGPSSGYRLLNWSGARVIPKNRKLVDEILAQTGITDYDIFGVSDVYPGLSVNDAFE